MRNWHTVIDPGKPNFVVQKWLEHLQDSTWKQIWVCDKTWLTPIRASLEVWKVTTVYCWMVNECIDCPFNDIRIDQSDY